MSQWSLTSLRGWGESAGHGVIRREPADFFVDEALGWQPSGAGEHLLVRLEKIGDNTDYVAGGLARLAGCRPVDVGYCGRKDRHAVTRQWFSIRRPDTSADEALIEAVGERWPVLEWARHSSKLRRGEHSANRFVIRVSEAHFDAEALSVRWERVIHQGCPNAFGAQRFGFDGGNLERAAVLTEKQLKNPRQRAKSGIYLSAARSWLFNQWLDRRIEAGDWLTHQPGDPHPRPSGPLFGDDACGADEPLAEREMAFAADYPQFMALFRATRMRPDRRELALKPVDCSLTVGNAEVTLAFEIPTGSFATAILHELMDIEDSSRAL